MKDHGKIRVLEMFSGVGAQATALENLGIEHECITSEIWQPAIIAYNAIHGDTPNLGDISKIEHIPEGIDLLTYSFPCTDISIAGKQEGFAEGSGTRSSLLWEVGRLLEDAKKNDTLPEFLVMENVEALLAEKNLPHFKKWIIRLNKLGYDSSYAVMNAKDFGVPQNRKRVFMVSSLHHGTFDFPEGFPLEKRLKDVLEKDVPESYYLSEEKIANYETHAKRHEGKGNGYGWVFHTEDEIANTVVTHPSKGTTQTLIEDIEVVGDLHMDGTLEQHNRVHSVEGIAPTVTTVLESPIIMEAGNLNNDTTFRRANVVLSGDGVAPTLTAEHVGINQPKVAVIEYPSNTSQGYMEAEEGDGLVMNRPTKARGTVQPQTAPTLTTGNGCGTGVVVKGDLCIENKHESDNRVYDTEGIAPTILAACGEGGGITPKIEESPLLVVSLYDKKESVPIENEDDVAAVHTPGRAEKRQNGPRCRNDGTAFTLTTQDVDGVARLEQGRLRIRYLTERECWRLQGFDDPRIDRAFDAVQSKGNRYKMAGNSIAVPCLEAIFRGMFIDHTFRPSSGRQTDLDGWF